MVVIPNLDAFVALGPYITYLLSNLFADIFIFAGSEQKERKGFVFFELVYLDKKGQIKVGVIARFRFFYFSQFFKHQVNLLYNRVSKLTGHFVLFIQGHLVTHQKIYVFKFLLNGLHLCAAQIGGAAIAKLVKLTQYIGTSFRGRFYG